jgi:hypothetical protein
MENKTENLSAITLSLVDRVAMVNILPNEGNFIKMVIAKDIDEKISLKQFEITDYEVKVIDKGLAWNQKGIDARFEIEFTKAEIELIKEQLLLKDKENKINSDMVNIYKLFVN